MVNNRARRSALPCLTVLALAACASPPPVPVAAPAPPPAVRTAAIPRLPEPMQCVPFAREVSGIEIYGDAWTWWDKAEGKFGRGQSPLPGAVLVLSKGERLRLGHVGVVKSVEGARLLTLTHANWGRDPQTRRIVHDAMPVSDVSERNDWTRVRLWNPEAKAWGGVYPAYGFVYRREVASGS